MAEEAEHPPDCIPLTPLELTLLREMLTDYSWRKGLRRRGKVFSLAIGGTAITVGILRDWVAWLIGVLSKLFPGPPPGGPD